MINPAEITNSLVSLLREIPELVAEVGGDPERIFAYHDLYPKRVSLELAKYQMPAPGNSLKTTRPRPTTGCCG